MNHESNMCVHMDSEWHPLLLIALQNLFPVTLRAISQLSSEVHGLLSSVLIVI